VFKVLEVESPEESDVMSTLKEINKKLWMLLILWDASAVREFLAQNNITTLPHPPYSPDLAS